MNPERASATKAAEPYTPPSTTLRGRWLFAFRAAWIVVAVCALGLFVASVPVAYAQYHAVCEGFECPLGRLSPGEVEALQELGFSVSFYATYALALDIVFASAFCLVGVVVFWRKSKEWMALFTSLALVTFGVSNTSLQMLGEVYSLLALPVTFERFLGTVLFFTLFCLFPDGRFVPRWTLVLAVVWLLYQGSYYFFPGSSFGPRAWSPLLDVSLLLGLLGALALAQIYRYRAVSGPVERQQTKWVVFGVSAALVVFIGTVLPAAIFPSLSQLDEVQFLYTLVGGTVTGFSLSLVPLSIGVAVLHYRLFDIDPIINRTLVYGLLTVSLALVYGTGVVALQGLFRAFTGSESNLAVVASTLAIALLFQPLRRRIQTFIDRRFYRRKYDAAKTLQAFGVRMRDEVDLEQLSEDLLAVTRETLQPAHVSLWLRPPKEDQ